MSRRWVFLLISILTLLCTQPADLVYPNAKQCSAPQHYLHFVDIPEGVTVSVYCVNEAIEKVLQYYKKIQGYELLNEVNITTVSIPGESFKIGGVFLKKGNEGLGISAISSREGETIFWLVKGPLDKIMPVTESKIEKLPQSDRARGEEPLNRYPKSVMLSHSKYGKYPVEIDIDYGTMDSVEKVFDWYKSNMIFANWKLEEESITAEKWWLRFKKGGEIVSIVIYPPDERKYTLISVEHVSYKAPEKDLASGEEPLQRYPNSKMVAYSITKFEGVKSVAITYATNDDYKTVANWFNTYLASAGWKNVVMTQEIDSITIHAVNSKGGIFISIVAHGTHSEIMLNYQGVW